LFRAAVLRRQTGVPTNAIGVQEEAGYFHPRRTRLQKPRQTTVFATAVIDLVVAEKAKQQYPRDLQRMNLK
jgi:ribosomal protein L25 (general stress protein Ctc)